jgi:hypothetical protein
VTHLTVRWKSGQIPYQTNTASVVAWLLSKEGTEATPAYMSTPAYAFVTSATAFSPCKLSLCDIESSRDSRPQNIDISCLGSLMYRCV